MSKRLLSLSSLQQRALRMVVAMIAVGFHAFPGINDFNGNLHDAAARGDSLMVRSLIDRGTDIDLKDNQGRTPLMHAVNNGHIAIIRSLIEHNADLNLSDSYGQTALILAVYGDHTAIAKLLIDKGADVNIRANNGVTALIYAASKDNVCIARWLLEKGADIHVKDNWGRTAFVYATSDSMVKLLLEKGARIQDKEVIRRSSQNLPVPLWILIILEVIVASLFGGLLRGAYLNLKKKAFRNAFFYAFMLMPIIIPLLYTFDPIKYAIFIVSAIFSWAFIFPKVRALYLRQSASWRIVHDSDDRLTLQERIPYRYTSILIWFSLVAIMTFVFTFSGIMRIPKNFTEIILMFVVAAMIFIVVIGGIVLFKPKKTFYDFMIHDGYVVKRSPITSKERLAFSDLSDIRLQTEAGEKSSTRIRLFGTGRDTGQVTELKDRYIIVLTFASGQSLQFGCGIDIEFALNLQSRFQSMIK